MLLKSLFSLSAAARVYLGTIAQLSELQSSCFCDDVRNASSLCTPVIYFIYFLLSILKRRIKNPDNSLSLSLSLTIVENQS